MEDGSVVARRDPRVERSRAAVLAACVELLVERGVSGTTIEAVAARSGVAKTTVYRQWDGRSALVLDALGSLLQPPADPGTGTLRGDLEVLLTGLADALTHGPAASLMTALVDAAERDPELAALHHREAAARHGVVLDVLRRGQARGELPPGADLQEVLDLLSGPLFYRRTVSGGRVDRTFARGVVDRVLRAYAPSPEEAGPAPRAAVGGRG